MQTPEQSFQTAVGELPRSGGDIRVEQPVDPVPQRCDQCLPGQPLLGDERVSGDNRVAGEDAVGGCCII
jgi:hypothetical protein